MLLCSTRAGTAYAVASARQKGAEHGQRHLNKKTKQKFPSLTANRSGRRCNRCETLMETNSRQSFVAICTRNESRLCKAFTLRDGFCSRDDFPVAPIRELITMLHSHNQPRPKKKNDKCANSVTECFSKPH